MGSIGSKMYIEACEILMIGDRSCAVVRDLWARFAEAWGRSPVDVVMEACAIAQEAEEGGEAEGRTEG